MDRIRWPVNRGKLAVVVALLLVIVFYMGELAPVSGDARMYLAHILSGNPFGDGSFQRLNAPFGAVIPWAETNDALLYAAGMVTQEAAGFAWKEALATGSAFVPPLLLGVAVVAFYRTLGSVVGDESAAVGTLVGFANPVVLNYYRAGMVDHHALLFTLAVLLVACARTCTCARSTREDAFGYAGLGLVSGLAVWTSPESLLFVVPVWAACLVCSAPGDLRGRWRLTGAAAVQVVVLVLALVLDPPHAGTFSVVADRMSVVYLLFGGLILVAAGLCDLVTERGDRHFWAVGDPLIAGVSAASVWFLVFPMMLDGPLAEVPPGLHDWESAIGEMRSIFANGSTLALTATAAPGVLALILLALRMRPRWPWLVAIVATSPVLVLGSLYLRFFPYASLIAGAGYGVMVGWLLRVWSGHERVVVIASLLLPFSLMGVILPFTDPSVSGRTDHAPGRVMAEALPDNRGVLVLAPLDTAPAVLWHTDHVRVVGGNYHRIPEGIRDVMRFRADRGNEDAYAVVRKRGVSHVIVSAYNSEKSVTMAERLAVGVGLPAWLLPVEGTDPRVRVYAVEPDER